jgi:hypothetical protein
MKSWHRVLRTGAIPLLACLLCVALLAQDEPHSMSKPADPTPATSPARNAASNTRATNAGATGGHRMLWVIPNARAQPISAQAYPLSTREKWQLVKKDALDPTSALTAAVVGGLGMAMNLHNEFGWGADGAAKYWSAALAGQEASKVLTGGVFPTLFHQDPRFFTRVSGTPGSRIVYAVSRELITWSDHGHSQFNASELAGVATAATIGNIYYTRARGPGPTAVRFGEQIGINAGFNVLKEFWPSIQKKLTRKK